MVRSTFIFVPADSATVPIDWRRVPEASKEYIKSSWGAKTLPATIGELAKAFDDDQFFGYMTPQLCTLLFDISEFGLCSSTAPVTGQLGPRFYMKYFEEMHLLIFIPGKRDGVTGSSPEMQSINYEDFEDDDVYDSTVAAAELEVAQTFDAELKEHTMTSESEATDELVLSVQMAGWQAVGFKKLQEEAQLVSALLTLPPGHPVLSAYMRVAFEQHWKRR